MKNIANEALSLQEPAAAAAAVCCKAMSAHVSAETSDESLAGI